MPGGIPSRPPPVSSLICRPLRYAETEISEDWITILSDSRLFSEGLVGVPSRWSSAFGL